MQIETPTPMLAQLVRELPEGDYVYEPKWDGFRCLAGRDGGEIELRSRHGRPLGRYFPELIAALEQLRSEEWVIDGEILVVVDGVFDFAALMQRLHPAASRVRELSARTPALYVAFDLPSADGEELLAVPFSGRRERLLALAGGAEPPLFVTPATGDRAVAARWLADFRGGGIDGVVAKRRGLEYQPGKRAMLKVKHDRTADCVVAGIRVGGEPPEVSALMLGLYDPDGNLEHVGVASGLARSAREEFTRELAPLVAPLEGHPWEHGFLAAGGPMGRLKGAAGRWMPGMTLDWVPLAPTRVAEVAYTQVDGRRLRHPAKFRRWRQDREPRSCLVDQLDAQTMPAAQVLESAS
jgi:ATP-dependent DNA ligase